MTMRKDFDHTRGDTLPIWFTLDRSIDLTEETTKVTFSVKEVETDNTYVLQVDKSAVSAVENEVDTYLLRVAPDKTNDLALGRYYYDLEIQTNGDIYTLVKGCMTISYDVTR